MTSDRRFVTADLTLCALCTAFLCVCSWLSIPLTVPVSLQIFGVYFTLLLLGGKRGTLSILCYLILGAIGLPVFSHFQGGLGILFGATGGYLFGFLLIAFLFWTTEKLTTAPWRLFAVMFVSLVLCEFCGSLWLAFVYLRAGKAVTAYSVFVGGVLAFLPLDLLKTALAYVTAKRIKKTNLFQKENVK